LPDTQAEALVIYECRQNPEHQRQIATSLVTGLHRFLAVRLQTRRADHPVPVALADEEAFASVAAPELDLPPPMRDEWSAVTWTTRTVKWTMTRPRRIAYREIASVYPMNAALAAAIEGHPGVLNLSHVLPTPWAAYHCCLLLGGIGPIPLRHDRGKCCLSVVKR
jgi:hypothetical protein